MRTPQDEIEELIRVITGPVRKAGRAGTKTGRAATSTGRCSKSAGRLGRNVDRSGRREVCEGAGNANSDSPLPETPAAESPDSRCPDIASLFSSPALYRTLAIFFDFPDDLLFPRQIGRHTGTDIKGVIRELRKLERLRVLYARGAGRWRRYGLDGGHLVHDELAAMFAKTRGTRRYRLQESVLESIFL